MSSNVSMIKKIFNKLSYEPVLESDSSVKSWINSHNNGHLTPFINGQFLAEKETDQLFQVKNPYNNDLLVQCVNADKSILKLAIDSALEAKSKWTSMSYTDRGRIIYNMARNVQKHLQLLTACESLQTGRTSREIKDCDIAALIRTLYYYSGGVVNANELMESYEPIGVVAIIGHFDSPLLSMIGKLAAALVTGNTCLLVPNSLSPLSCYMFIDLCVQSGLPNGCVNLVVSDNDEILKFISTDPRIDCVTFDGNLTTGQDLIVSQAFVNPNKRTLLSLNGKSSMVIYDSADIDSAIETTVDGCFYANGQHRYSLNKLFIQENIYDDVVRRLELRFSKLKVGNHLDKCNDYGPIYNSNELKSVLENQSNELGSNVKQFNEAVQNNDPAYQCLVPPTLIQYIGLNSQLNLNEVNGPYLMLIPFRTVKESIELVNNSKFGAGVSIHSQDISLVLEVITLLNTGTVWVNSFPIERGVQVRKCSGNYKLSGIQSMLNFVRPKFETNLTQDKYDVEEVKKKFKSVGSLSTPALVPAGQTLVCNKTYKLYVGGKQTRPDTQSSRPIYMPDSSSLYCLVADSSRKDVRNAVESACSAFNSWSKRSNHNKSQILYFLAENFITRSSELTDKLELLTKKSKSDCEKEIKLCYDALFYFASLCDKTVGQLNDSTEYGYLMEIKEPLGCIAIICGFKSSTPLYSFILHLTAAISYGNTVVIVPDETCPCPALDLYEILETSDMPDGVINILSGQRHHLTKYLVEHQQVNAVWYINDDLKSNTLSSDEQLMQQFIRFTSNYNLKHCWLINNEINMNNNNDSVSKHYLQELKNNSVQYKYAHIPMGVIFAN